MKWPAGHAACPARGRGVSSVTGGINCGNYLQERVAHPPHQQMNVLGHDHETHEREDVFVAHSIEDLQKSIPCPGGAKKWKPPIATARDEMQIVLPVSSLQPVLHGLNPKQKRVRPQRQRPNTHPSPKPRRMRHPPNQDQGQTSKTTPARINHTMRCLSDNLDLSRLSRAGPRHTICGAGKQ